MPLGLPDLPQELLELILFDLDADSLRACALVSSPLLPPSQRLIFRSLVISYADIPKAQSLFAAAPHILGYVCDLLIELEPSLSLQNSVIASILSSFPHLQCLTIKGKGVVEWEDMTLPLRSAVQNLLASTDFYSLNVAGFVDVPPSFILLALSSIRRLGLYSITVDASESQVLDRPATLRTEELTVRAPYLDSMKRITDLILQNNSKPGYLRNIRQLTVGMHRAAKPESLRLISATANALRHLQLRCGVFQTHIDLPYLPVLQAIELKFYLGFTANTLLNLYSTIATFPTTIPAIENLGFTFYGALADREDSVTEGFTSFPLFDDTCAYREKLPCLRRVHCHGHAGDSVEFNAYVQRKFPGLWGTGVLMITAGGGDEESSFD
ncbi:hypothetical protein B0H12DRAFT_89755 [Mycena haematopus]|nr:hypothetical protein B0H12DRAFT_89755 [Mycena haematopus]